ncbi:hypothetical protein DES52_107156 [Deinococcus yavapaiensis KR-236]|uniref:Uncharacterized protein n=2 Tax=Deinococcus TaxID=1298 RepID=A0A318S837_9DEIO|nr:hypothetical protein DES52_107156 [Deinococcus yavapaiensis KR-236]
MNQLRARFLLIPVTAAALSGSVEATDFGMRNLKGVRVCTDEASVQAQDNTELQHALLVEMRRQLRVGTVSSVEGACQTRRDAVHLIVDVDYQIKSAFSTEIELFNRNLAGFADALKVYQRGSFGVTEDEETLMEFVMSEFDEFVMDWREQNDLPTTRSNRQT